MIVDNENTNTEPAGGILDETIGEALQPEESKRTYIKQEKTDKAYWYVVYTYSGYENKVMTNLLKTVENNGLHDSILDVKVPMEETIEIKNGKKKHVQRKLYPGYVMVKMFLTDETWYVVRKHTGRHGLCRPGKQADPAFGYRSPLDGRGKRTHQARRLCRRKCHDHFWPVGELYRHCR